MMTPRVDRRRFLSMFAAGSAGMAAADKIGFFEELKKWVLSPSKTILIPEPKIISVNTLVYEGKLWQYDPNIQYLFDRTFTLYPDAKIFTIEVKCDLDKNGKIINISTDNIDGYNPIEAGIVKLTKSGTVKLTKEIKEGRIEGRIKWSQAPIPG